jgi:hypothetical protein
MRPTLSHLRMLPPRILQQPCGTRSLAYTSRWQLTGHCHSERSAGISTLVRGDSADTLCPTSPTLLAMTGARMRLFHRNRYTTVRSSLFHFPPICGMIQDMQPYAVGFRHRSHIAVAIHPGETRRASHDAVDHVSRPLPDYSTVTASHAAEPLIYAVQSTGPGPFLRWTSGSRG